MALEEQVGRLHLNTVSAVKLVSVWIVFHYYQPPAGAGEPLVSLCWCRSQVIWLLHCNHDY